MKTDTKRNAEVKHCGKENCEGQWCQNWGTCRGETIPPWSVYRDPAKTDAVLIREQDVLSAADELARRVLEMQASKCLECCTSKDSADCSDCELSAVGLCASEYQRVRNGVMRNGK